jgi:cytolysin (calcineurin-like family phosphatase)
MKGETPEQQWERLQREYQSAVQTSYPNPEQHGCPGADVLRDLAARSARQEDIEQDEHWKHVIHCGPCYQEYLDLRVACPIGDDSKVRRGSR